MSPIHMQIPQKEGLLECDVGFTVFQGRANIGWLLSVVIHHSAWPRPPAIDFVHIQFNNSPAVVFPPESICYNFRIHLLLLFHTDSLCGDYYPLSTLVFYSERPMFGFCGTDGLCNSTEILCVLRNPLRIIHTYIHVKDHGFLFCLSVLF
jgi:hypothetical protein